jgi:AraC-binding-like domain
MREFRGRWIEASGVRGGPFRGRLRTTSGWPISGSPGCRQLRPCPRAGEPGWHARVPDRTGPGPNLPIIYVPGTVTAGHRDGGSAMVAYHGIAEQSQAFDLDRVAGLQQLGRLAGVADSRGCAGLFRDTLNSRFYPAWVESLDRHAVMREPWLPAVDLILTTIGYVCFGATASVDPGDLPAYHVNVVISGTVDSRSGTSRRSRPRGWPPSSAPTGIPRWPRWDADAAQLSIKFERSQVEQELAGLLGRPVVKPIDFRLALPVDDGAGRRWMSVLSALLQSADGPRGTTELRHLESPSPRRNPARSRPWLHPRRSRQDRRNQRTQPPVRLPRAVRHHADAIPAPGATRPGT